MVTVKTKQKILKIENIKNRLKEEKEKKKSSIFINQMAFLKSWYRMQEFYMNWKIPCVWTLVAHAFRPFVE